MKMSGQLHASAALPPGEEYPVPTGYGCFYPQAVTISCSLVPSWIHLTEDASWLLVVI